MDGVHGGSIGGGSAYGVRRLFVSLCRGDADTVASLPAGGGRVGLSHAGNLHPPSPSIQKNLGQDWDRMPTHKKMGYDMLS